MNNDQITKGFNRLFHEEGSRVVFWQDPDREFEESLGDIELGDVKLLRLDEIPALEVKVLIEKIDKTSRYLLYAPFEKPEQENDWLLDIRLYSQEFRADRSSILLSELGLQQQSLRSHLSDRVKFFASKDRLSKLKNLVIPNDSAETLDRKILAVCVRADQADFFNILITMLHGIPRGDLDASPISWSDIQKFGVENAFWTLVQDTFGYTEEEPTIKNFLIRLFVSDFSQSIQAELPDALEHLVLSKKGATNAMIVLGQWRDSHTRGSSYELLSSRVADAIHLEQHLGSYKIETLLDSKTFLPVDKYIASRVRDQVIESFQSIDLTAVQNIISRRLDSYWVSSDLPDTHNAPRKALTAVYLALLSASEFFQLLGQYPDGFYYTSAELMYSAYTENLYHFDQHYRHFCEQADYAEAHDWDILKTLRDEVENSYCNGYLTPLALAWSEHLEKGLMNSWVLDGVPRQVDFFKNEVASDSSSDRRVFVLISDAFRYEVAQELEGKLNKRYRFKAELNSQLGVLPSYTSLGMAALLPHTSLRFNDKAVVQVDGKPCSSLDQRSKVLAGYDGVAIKAPDFMAMKKDEGREFIKPYKVIYIYHDQIDAMGDKAATESRTFDAARTTINELGDLVTKIINTFNANQVLITADHGFLFQESALTETDKNRIDEKPAGTVMAKKRYLLGRDLPDSDLAYHGSTTVTADTDDGMEFWVPKGNNRFHFVGGSRFIHGGAMLQEITVPVIKVRQIKGDKVAQTRVKTVGVTVLGNNFKVTTNRHRFRLIQTEAVGDRVKEIILKVGIYEGDQPISNVETIRFDSASKEMNDWEKTISLTLESRTYDKNGVYQLILREAGTELEQARFDLTIDLAFTNDF